MLEELKNTCGRPATRELYAMSPFLSKDTRLFSVEPGDATHYTVAVNDRTAMAWVGTPGYLGPELVKDRVYVLAFGGLGVTRATGASNEYQREILEYLCCLALNIPKIEPPELTEMRQRAKEQPWS